MIWLSPNLNVLYLEKSWILSNSAFIFCADKPKAEKRMRNNKNVRIVKDTQNAFQERDFIQLN
jgi:hypothetical protein